MDQQQIATLDRYLAEVQDKLHAALGFCVDQDIPGFKDLQLLVGEIQQLRRRAANLERSNQW